MISLVAAMSKNRVIGRGGKIPWHLPADLKRFKELTMGHPVIMGRKTYESLGRALPGRTNVVLSRTPGFNPPDAVTVPSLKEAFDLVRGVDEIFIIGGQSLYEQALPLADKIYLTAVDVETEGNAFFPKFNENGWNLVSREEHKKDERNQHDYTYLVYEQKK